MDRLSVRAAPVGLAPSFGFGDRLGLATRGHIEALRRSKTGIFAVLAQQSIREMTRTGRTPAQVMEDAHRGAAEAGFTDAFGADADHLKTVEDVTATADAGFVMFTLDPSDYVDANAGSLSPSELQEKLRPVRDEVDWVLAYRGRSIKLETGTVLSIDEIDCLRAAVKYGLAVNHAIMLARAVEFATRGRAHEIELSIDETPEPTSLAEHFIIADRCLREGVKLVSLAPRFVGDFEKAVDFRGDLRELERSLADHSAIARMLGPYKLSLHSGSDKLSIYPTLARLTRGMFHVKTAGTSYLEALRTVARHDAALLRRVIDLARDRYPADRATYHVSAVLENIPAPADVADDRELERLYLGDWNDVPDGPGFTTAGRQILHTTYGSVLNDATLGPEVLEVLREHAATYRELLAAHLGRHLRALAL